MTQYRSLAVVRATAIAVAAALAWPVMGAEVLSPPRPAELKQAVDAWLAQRGLENSPVVDAIKPLWQLEENASTQQLFDALMQTFYYVDDDARGLIDACRTLSYSPQILSVALSSGYEDEPLFAHNLRLFYGKHLATLTLYEEALSVLARTDVTQVVDPASYLFYRGVCEHHLLLRKEGLATLSQLLNDTQRVPDRYRQLGELIRDDLQKVEEKSLDEVARQMRDVERRLSLGRAGEGVQEVERRIIATLDELIKKIEDQLNQSSSPAGGAASGPATKPAEESYLGGVKGPGLTDRKEIGHKDHWGDLPPKAQAAAKNMLDRQFPPHYRQAVEEYLKKLADRPAPKR